MDLYCWVGQPTKHHARFRTWFKKIDGKKMFQSFDTMEAAREFVAGAQGRVIPRGGRPFAGVVEAFLGTRPLLKDGSRATLRYRLLSIAKGREKVPIEAFPWAKGWKEHVAPQSGDSQHAILAALTSLAAFAGLKGDPLRGVAVSKVRRQGKPQLRIDEARTFIATALAAGDPLALAASTMVLTGLRPAEAMALQARDVDDGGALLWIDGTKTRAARRTVPVEAAFRPMLVGAAKGKAAGDLLFEYAPRRVRKHADDTKARVDALRRRVRDLCREAGVPEVVPHSLRGLNSTLRKQGGADDDQIARALGHTSTRVTRRHYLDATVSEHADARRTHGRLLAEVAA